MPRLHRRKALEVLGSAGVAAVAAACGDSIADSAVLIELTSTTTTTDTTGTTNSSACVVSPEETIGPYPDITGMLNNPAFNRRT